MQTHFLRFLNATPGVKRDLAANRMLLELARCLCASAARLSDADVLADESQKISLANSRCGQHLDGRMQAVFADCAMTRVQSCKLFKRLVSVSSFRWHEIGNQGPQG